MSFHENFSFHPFFVEDLGTIGNLFARVDIFKSRVFRLFVNAVGTCQLKSEDGLIAGQALFVVIVPNCAFHTFVDRYEHIMAIEHNTNDRAAMEIEELPKFMYLNFLSKLHLWFGVELKSGFRETKPSGVVINIQPRDISGVVINIQPRDKSGVG